jgi:hypothetical protein
MQRLLTSDSKIQGTLQGAHATDIEPFDCLTSSFVSVDDDDVGAASSCDYSEVY